jgi:hypothetical protein
LTAARRTAHDLLKRGLAQLFGTRHRDFVPVSIHFLEDRIGSAAIGFSEIL